MPAARITSIWPSDGARGIAVINAIGFAAEVKERFAASASIQCRLALQQRKKAGR